MAPGGALRGETREPRGVHDPTITGLPIHAREDECRVDSLPARPSPAGWQPHRSDWKSGLPTCLQPPLCLITVAGAAVVHYTHFSFDWMTRSSACAAVLLLLAATGGLHRCC